MLQHRLKRKTTALAATLTTALAGILTPPALAQAQDLTYLDDRSNMRPWEAFMVWRWDWQFIAEQWEKGGTTMWFLLFLSIMAVAFLLERAVRLRRSTIVPGRLAQRADDLWRAGQYAELREMAKRDRSILGQIIAFVVRHRRRPMQEVAAGAADIATRELRPHFRRAFPLLVVATLAPLLGLFGTVLGMMEAFENFRLMGERGDPNVLASSISKAMVTTAFGLAIAIFALAAYHYFRTRTNKLGDQLESDATDLMTEWLMPEEVEDAR